MPITPSTNNKRYAVFVYDTLYILNVKTPLRKINALRQHTVKQNGGTYSTNDADDADDADESSRVLDDYTSIFFIENNRHTWCIKSIERFVEI